VFDSNQETERLLIWLSAFVAMAAIISWLILNSLGPVIIEQAYHGNSFSIFNALITGQKDHPLSEYLSDFSVRVRTVFFFLLTISGILYLLSKILDKTTSSALAAVTVGLVSILLFLPICPVMPRLGLDPSWILGANEAVAQGMQYGKDIIYTIGPLSSIWTQAYHPEIIQITIIGGIFFVIGQAFITYKLAKNSQLAWLLAYAVVMIFLLESRDTLFLAYPIFLSFLIYRISLPESHVDHISLSKIESILFIFVISSLGLLPIIKFSFLPLTLVVSALGSILLWRSGKKLVAVSLTLSPPVIMILFWMAVNQSIQTLLDYFSNASLVASGYTQAMSINYYLFSPALFLFSSMLVVLFFFQAQKDVGINKYLFILILMAFLFLSFKAGFVRHDVHALTASSSLVIAAIFLGSLNSVRRSKLIMIFMISLIAWAYIHIQHRQTSFEYYKPLSWQIVSTIKEWSSGKSTNTSEKDRYNAHLSDIRQSNPLPEIQGTVDIYPYDMSLLIASGNQWSPRPVYQSFSAYTPELAILNASYLAKKDAPDNILFSIKTIDGRYPSLDDGTSWPVLFTRYELTDVVDDYLLLKKRDHSEKQQRMSLAFSGQVNLGEIVDLSDRKGIIYTEIEINQSLIGKLFDVLYKQTPLKITAELSNGTTQTHRFIPGQAISGFILSPYIESTDDFRKVLITPLENDVPLVKNFKIEEKPFSVGMWKNSYSIKIYEVSTTQGSLQ
jgi:hypothetical protein